MTISHYHFDHAGGLRTAAAEGAQLLVQADSFTPSASDSPPPAKINDNNLNLEDNNDRLKIAVDGILALHGRVVPLTELHRMIGR